MTAAKRNAGVLAGWLAGVLACICEAARTPPGQPPRRRRSAIYAAAACVPTCT